MRTFEHLITLGMAAAVALALAPGCSSDTETDPAPDSSPPNASGAGDASTDSEPSDTTDDTLPHSDTGTDAADTMRTDDTADATDNGDTAESPDNLLENPNFEEGSPTSGCPTAWSCVTYEPSESGEFSTVASGSYAGDQVARWTGTETPITVVKQRLSSEPGRRYEVSVWVDGENLTTKPFATVLFDGEDGRLDYERFHADEIPDGWTQITAETSPTPVGTREVRFNLGTDGTSGTVRWDAASMVDITEPDDEPSDPEPADYEIVEAQGQTIRLSDGEVLENKLFDLTTGDDLTITTSGATGWTIRNVGFKGRKQTPGALFGVGDYGDGESVVKNLYLGDGSGRNGGQATCGSTDGCTHGPVGIWVDPDHSGHLTFENINVQGWPNNGIYGSAPGSNGNGARGTIHIDASYGANNYVSSFRIAGSDGNRITDTVAFNDGDDYDGRPIWVWKPGPVRVENVDLDEGSYPYALDARNTEVHLTDSEVRGSLRESSGSTIVEDNVGSNPDLTPPDGVPMTAEEAAAGRAGR